MHYFIEIDPEIGIDPEVDPEIDTGPEVGHVIGGGENHAVQVGVETDIRGKIGT